MLKPRHVLKEDVIAKEIRPTKKILALHWNKSRGIPWARPHSADLPTSTGEPMVLLLTESNQLKNLQLM